MKRSHIEIVFGNESLLLDASGAMYWPRGEWLIVSDLHLEKASFLAQFGSPLPRYDTRDTLHKLERLISQYKPLQVVCLGDSFHDRGSYQRLEAADKMQLHQLAGSVTGWNWVLGNHDPSLPNALPGRMHTELSMSAIRLLHEPAEGKNAQIVGHFHPKCSYALGSHAARGKAFIHDENLLIMPAFGSYTGGLDIRHTAIQSLMDKPKAYLLYGDAIWNISREE